MEEPSAKLADVSSTKDHLSLLPSELLEIIFNCVRDKHPLGPISKRLLPFTRSTLYRNVALTSQAQLAKFCQTIADCRALRPLVHTLDVSVEAPEAHAEGAEQGEEGGAVEAEGASTGQRGGEEEDVVTRQDSIEVDAETLRLLLQSLPRLSGLGVSRHLQTMTDVVVSDAFTTNHGKSIKEIRLCFDNTPTPEALRPLVHLPALSHLSLLADATPDALLDPTNPWDVDPDDLFSDFFIPNIKHLRLGGSFIGPGLPMLALLFPSAEEVQLHACPWDLVTTPIFSFLHPDALTELTIVQSPLLIDGRSMPVRSFGDSFSRFSNLTYLALDTAADLGPLFPHLVSPLPLKHIIFGEHSRPKVAQLKPLLLGPQRLTELCLLEVNSVVSGQSGNPLRVEDVEELDKAIQARQDGEKEVTFGEWTLPDWYEGFTSSDAEDLLRSTSEEQEVVVEGSFIEALIHERIFHDQTSIARGERPALTEEDVKGVPGPAPMEAKEAAYWAMAGVLYVTALMGTRGRKTLDEVLRVEEIDLRVLGVGEE